MWIKPTKNNLIINLSNIDFLTVLPNDINIKVDRASMAHSLEVRTPLYDKRIIKFSREVPVDYHLKHGTKSLMRSILYKNLQKATKYKQLICPFWLQNKVNLEKQHICLWNVT